MRNNLTQKSLRELYDTERAKPTAAQTFVLEVMNVTKRKENTVRQWLMGLTEPDDLVKEALSKHFGIPAGKLFPARN